MTSSGRDRSLTSTFPCWWTPGGAVDGCAGARTVCGPHAREKHAMSDAAEPASATELLKAACVWLGTSSGDMLRCLPPPDFGSRVTRSRREIGHLDRKTRGRACVPLPPRAGSHVRTQVSMTSRYTHVSASGHDGRRRADRRGAVGTDVSQLQPELQPGPEAAPRGDGITAGESEWGGWDSNPRPADYENYGPLHHAR